jgi:uncharacterized protein (TIGR00369 family)
MKTPPSDPPTATRRHGPFQDLVGYEILGGDAEPYFRLPVRRDLLNPHGVIHGGVTLTLLDGIGGRSLVDRIVPATGQRVLSSVTVTLTTDFILAVSSGTLFALATPDHIGKTLAYVSVQLRQDALDGPVIARGLGTYRIYTKSLLKAV